VCDQVPLDRQILPFLFDRRIGCFAGVLLACQCPQPVRRGWFDHAPVYSCVFDKNQSLIAVVVFRIFPPPKPVALDDSDSPPNTIAVLVDPADRAAGGKVAGVSVLRELATRLVVERSEQRASLQ
jgi:hypothetical protein